VANECLKVWQVARFVMPDAAGRLARRLLPEAGVRAPGATDMRMSGSGESDGVLFVAFARAPLAGAGSAANQGKNDRPGTSSIAKVPDEATLAALAATGGDGAGTAPQRVELCRGGGGDERQAG